MNWYKTSQRHYTDIGHYERWSDDMLDEKNLLSLWVCGSSGQNFQRADLEPGSIDSHNEFFEIDKYKEFHGRYDPFKNMVSVSIPYQTGSRVAIEPENISNKVINRLMSEYPGASIWAFPINNYTDTTQII